MQYKDTNVFTPQFVAKVLLSTFSSLGEYSYFLIRDSISEEQSSLV